jgi:hypothetical protein
MAIKQYSILALRLGIETSERSRLSRRSVVTPKRAHSKRITKKRRVCSPRRLRQLDMYEFLEVPASSASGCPALPDDVWRMIMGEQADGKRARRAAAISKIFAVTANEHVDNVAGVCPETESVRVKIE